MNSIRAVVALLGLSIVGHRAAPAADNLPEPIVTAETEFAIPVSIDAADAAVAEVRLYVSEDAGTTWRVESRLRPTSDSFTFRAAHAGEYWFLVRTADAAGVETPTGAKEPELRVVVEAPRPQLQLTLERAATGALVAKWKVDAGRETADTLKLSYRRGAEGPWREVHAAATKRQGDETGTAGEVQWTPPAGDGPVMVRAEVRDAAGRVTASEATSTEAQGPALAAVPLEPIRSLPVSRPPKPGADSPAAAPQIALRDPTRPLSVNSPSFELDYDVDRAEAASVTEVQVWGTRDDGQSWIKLGTDDDKRTPCAVNVDRDGMYGFKIVVVGGSKKERSPKSGDAPEIRVRVDLEAPQVHFTTAEADPEGRPSALKINWQAVDDNLGPQAVSLAYGTSPTGPWLPLAVGIENSGSYAGQFGAQAPDAVYLRIEVRDEGGNLGACSTKAPVPLERRPVQVHASADKTRPASSSKWYYVLH